MSAILAEKVYSSRSVAAMDWAVLAVAKQTREISVVLNYGILPCDVIYSIRIKCVPNNNNFKCENMTSCKLRT